MSDLHISDVFRVPYPFIRDTYSWLDEDGGGETLTWKPGVRNCETHHCNIDQMPAPAEREG